MHDVYGRPVGHQTLESSYYDESDEYGSESGASYSDTQEEVYGDVYGYHGRQTPAHLVDAHGVPHHRPIYASSDEDDDEYGDYYDDEVGSSSGSVSSGNYSSGSESSYGDEDMSMYQDGIFEDDLDEDDISENARHYPSVHGRRRRHNAKRRSIHRYPHHTHKRRATPHSLADSRPTHFGQQHPYHPHHADLDQEEDGAVEPKKSRKRTGRAHRRSRRAKRNEESQQSGVSASSNESMLSSVESNEMYSDDGLIYEYHMDPAYSYTVRERRRANGLGYSSDYPSANDYADYYGYSNAPHRHHHHHHSHSTAATAAPLASAPVAAVPDFYDPYAPVVDTYGRVDPYARYDPYDPMPFAGFDYQQYGDEDDDDYYSEGSNQNESFGFQDGIPG